MHTLRWAVQQPCHMHPTHSQVMDVARKNTITRIKRCCTIMGRQEGDDNVSSAQIFYPCMQCADVFFLKVRMCVVEVEVGEERGRGFHSFCDF